MGAKILVIDDDILMLGVLDCFLTVEGFQTLSLEKARFVDYAVSDFRPDLILMDIHLDTADGRTICDGLKSRADTSHIPIILLTGLDYNEIARIDCQADAIIGKPYENASLLLTINQFITTG